MATQRLNNMSVAQVKGAVAQIFDNEHFWVRNSHVPVATRLAVRNNVVNNRVWPAYPLFSPYAATHDGYSQGMFNNSQVCDASNFASSI
jgi:hypothetical protein